MAYWERERNSYGGYNSAARLEGIEFHYQFHCTTTYHHGVLVTYQLSVPHIHKPSNEMRFATQIIQRYSQNIPFNTRIFVILPFQFRHFIKNSKIFLVRVLLRARNLMHYCLRIKTYSWSYDNSRVPQRDGISSLIAMFSKKLFHWTLKISLISLWVTIDKKFIKQDTTSIQLKTCKLTCREWQTK